MGAASSSSMLTASLVVEVEASQQIVWDTATEVDTSPAFIEHVLEFEIVGNDKNIKQGSIIRSVRLFRGQKIELLYTITVFDPPRTIRTIASSIEPAENVGGKGSAWVGSYTFIPVSDTKCQFVCTWASSMDSMRRRLLFLPFRCCILRQINQSFRKDIQDIAAEAERRQKVKISKALEMYDRVTAAEKQSENK